MTNLCLLHTLPASLKTLNSCFSTTLFLQLLLSAFVGWHWIKQYCWENTPWRAASEEETVPSDAGESLKLRCTGPATEANVHMWQGTKRWTLHRSWKRRHDKTLQQRRAKWLMDMQQRGTEHRDGIKSNVLPAQRAARPGGREPRRTPLCCSAGPQSWLAPDCSCWEAAGPAAEP